MTTELATRTPAATSTPSRTRTVVIATVALLAGAGIAAGAVLGLTGTAPAPAPLVPAAAATSASTTGASTTGAGSSTVHHHAVVPASPPAHHVTPAAPSAAIETLQRELGQLNYYEGPITGTMTSQTTQAITYLQRDAHLPRTGTMNAATQAALANFLAHGNNQMGS